MQLRARIHLQLRGVSLYIKVTPAQPTAQPAPASPLTASGAGAPKKRPAVTPAVGILSRVYMYVTPTRLFSFPTAPASASRFTPSHPLTVSASRCTCPIEISFFYRSMAPFFAHYALFFKCLRGHPTDPSRVSLNFATVRDRLNPRRS